MANDKQETLDEAEAVDRITREYGVPHTSMTFGDALRKMAEWQREQDAHGCEIRAQICDIPGCHLIDAAAIREGGKRG